MKMALFNWRPQGDSPTTSSAYAAPTNGRLSDLPGGIKKVTGYFLTKTLKSSLSPLDSFAMDIFVFSGFIDIFRSHIDCINMLLYCIIESAV